VHVNVKTEEEEEEEKIRLPIDEQSIGLC